MYTCACGMHLARHSALLSKAFQGRFGQAFLFEAAYVAPAISTCLPPPAPTRHHHHNIPQCSVNVSLGPVEDRMLLTGMHTVADLFCVGCGQPLGWQYLEAFEESQKYKEGRVILEVAKLRKARWAPGDASDEEDSSS